jgi:methionyl-tRNA synthetase
MPTTIYVHGFINLNGEKISKSRGNVIRPNELTEQFGVDAIRYYFLRYGPITEDVDISLEHLKEVYNSDLANGLGNTVSRIARLAEKSGFSFPILEDSKNLPAGLEKYFDQFRVDLAIQNVWENLASLDKHISDNEPWSIKDSEKLSNILIHEVNEIRRIAKILEIFIPETSQKIQRQFKNERIVFEGGLFPRIS